eukprot:TRINITY_DN3178_c1_g1_i1.p1 TRINITY_DN3178_c1_g1~~TRINITY_DN3178_c1_g1_i1.p1  ORF type:complete len:1202 (+),score=172.40 TRINITY_DN3178_c1_g1_i1:139-3606(+)
MSAGATPRSAFRKLTSKPSVRSFKSSKLETEYTTQYAASSPWAAAARLLLGLSTTVLVAVLAKSISGGGKLEKSAATYCYAAIASVFLVSHFLPNTHAANFVAAGNMIAAIVAGVVCGLPWLPVSMCAFALTTLRSRAEAELSLRHLFLGEVQMMAKACQFYHLISDMLPAALLRRYFDICLSVDHAATISSVSMGESRPRCGVLFVAICGFDEVVLGKSSKFVVRYLNQLFSAFDKECSQAAPHVLKIETVAETHMSACGIFPSDDPECTSEVELASLARLALRIHEVAEGFGVTVRAGIHYGPVVAGIIGDTLPRFRLFGDTVNTAARLEQHCPPGAVLVTDNTAQVLSGFGIVTRPHGTINMKGLGDVDTFVFSAGEAVPKVVAVDEGEAEPPAHCRTKSHSWHTLTCVEPASRRTRSSVSFVFDDEKLEIVEKKRATAPELRCSVDKLAEMLSPSDTLRSSRTLSTQSPASTLRQGTLCESSDSEDEDPPPRHTRTRTPTAWMSAKTQLSLEGDSDDGDGEDDLEDDDCYEDEVMLDERDDGQAQAEVRQRIECALREGRGDNVEDLVRWLWPAAAVSECDAEVQKAMLAANNADARMEIASVLHGDAFEDAFRIAHAFRCLASGHAVPVSLTLVVLMLVAVPLSLRGELSNTFAAILAVEAAIASSLACGALFVVPHFGPCLATHIFSVGLSTSCAFMVAGYHGSFGEAAPWIWLAAGLELRIPPRSAAVSAIVAVVISGVMRQISAVCAQAIVTNGREADMLSEAASTTAFGTFLFTSAVLVVFLLADENVQRQRFRVQHIAHVTQRRWKEIAESLMPSTYVQELREITFRPGISGERSQPLTGGATSPCRGLSPLVSHVHDSLTLLQSDLVGFTAFARQKEPQELVCVINSLFKLFDLCVARRKVYKVETVGDAYICASGLPDASAHSASAMLLLANDIRRELTTFKAQCGLPDGLNIRVGLHTGSCVGGIVGTYMKRYHLFGRTMRIVELLESTAPTGSIHVSETVKQRFDEEVQKGSAADDVFRFIEYCPGKDLKTSKGVEVPWDDIDNLDTFTVELAALQQKAGREAQQRMSRDLSISTESLEGRELPLQWYAAVAEDGGRSVSKPESSILREHTPRMSAAYDDDNVAAVAARRRRQRQSFSDPL